MTEKTLVVRFDGHKELEEAFNALAFGAQKKIFRPALRVGGKVIFSAVKARVPRDTGALAKAIKLRSQRRSRKRIGVSVFVDNKLIPLGKSEQQHNRKGFYPAHVELGYVRKTKNNTFHIPPRSYLRAGFDAVKEQAMQAIIAEAGRRMDILFQKPKASLDEGGE